MATSSEGVLESCDDVDIIFSTLSVLVKPPESGDSVVNILSSIQNNLSKAELACGRENIDKWMKQQDLFTYSQYDSEDTSWKFVCICLTSLLRLKQIMKESQKETLVSVNQKGVIKSSLQFVNALGIAPFLTNGVGLSVESRSRATNKYVTDLKSSLSESDQNKRISVVVRALIKLTNDKSWDLYGTVFSAVIMDLLPALVQLSWGPKVDVDSRKEFQILTRELVTSTHQPTMIRELMVCLNPRPQTPPPVWYLRACSKLLTQCLLFERGVVSTVRALHDLSHSEEHQSRRYDTTAKLLMGPHGPDANKYHLHLCPQLVELLKSGNDEYKKVATETVKLLWAKHPDLCQQQILTLLWQPFCIDLSESEGNLVLEKCQEEDLSLSLQAISSLISLDGLPVDTLISGLPHLCAFYSATWQRGGTPQLRSMNKEVLSQIMTHSDNEQVWKSIFNLPHDCLLSLTTDSATASVVFINLLQFLHQTQNVEEKVVYCQLLMTVAEIPSVQKECLQKPNVILINTIKSFIEDCDSEMVPVALLLLGTMVAECDDFSQYKSLVPALQRLRQNIGLTESLRAIAEEIIASITTFGAMGMDKTSQSKQDVLHQPASSSTKSTPYKPTPATKQTPHKPTASPHNICYTQAMQETTDTEIPTQGHGFLALTKLIKNKDEETLQAQEKIFVLCLEGLQHEDSYVYLAACGALSALTLSSLDTLLTRVMENYCRVEHGPTLRTRLGEVLLQVCKALGEMAGKHRATLLNAFLLNSKDKSPAVRTSSVSNLGEACRVLGFQVSSQLQEILMCAHCLATSDPEMEVRRAAAMLVTLLLRGLGSQAVSVLGADALDVYRGLKHLASSEDETLALQAQLALEELSIGIKQDVFAPQPLEKKIYISSPPP